MDAILLILIPSPRERSKAIFDMESEAERQQISGKTWQPPGKHLHQSTDLPSSNVLAETCEEPILDFHLPGLPV